MLPESCHVGAENSRLDLIALPVNDRSLKESSNYYPRAKMLPESCHVGAENPRLDLPTCGM